MGHHRQKAPNPQVAWNTARGLTFVITWSWTLLAHCGAEQHTSQCTNLCNTYNTCALTPINVSSCTHQCVTDTEHTTLFNEEYTYCLACLQSCPFLDVRYCGPQCHLLLKSIDFTRPLPPTPAQ